MQGDGHPLREIGVVESPLRDRDAAPLQGDEGAPDAWIAIDPKYAEALDGVRPGARLIVLSWLDRADRQVLKVHPRGDESRTRLGVFATRSPDRPNPIGLHPVEVLAVESGRIHVRGLEAIDGTPVIDLKPELPSRREER